MQYFGDRKKGLTAVGVLSAALALSACGGGGSGGSASIESGVVIDDDSQGGDGGINFPEIDSGFIQSVTINGSRDTRAIALGDIDGDGDLDLVEANRLEAARVFTNNGDGTATFTDTGQEIGAGAGFLQGTSLGDVDGDGDLDLLLNTGSSNFRIFLNSGLGVFTDSGVNLENGDLGRFAALGDVDGDEDLDVVVVGRASLTFDSNIIFLNDGSGNFVNSGSWRGFNPPEGDAVFLEDLDGDSDLDAFVLPTFSSDESDQIYLNDGSGNFTEVSQSLGQSDFVVFGDVDNDSDIDLISLSSGPSRSSQVFLNDSNGNFSNSNQVLGPSQSSEGAVLADFNVDGDLDLVIVNNDGQSDRFYENDGVGNFGLLLVDSSIGIALPNDNLLLSNSQAVAAGDIDGDGDIDIVVGTSNANRILLNGNP